MKKQLISIAAAATLFGVLPTSIQAAQPAFTDIEKSYAIKEIQTLVEADIIAGYPDGTFGPKRNITRAEFARILANALELPANEPAANIFSDVPSWAAPEVGALVEAGIVFGLSEDTYGASELITREDMMTMIIRGLGFDDFSRFTGFYPEFKDWEKVSDYAFNDVGLATFISLAKGTNDGYFLPDQPAERQAAVRWIYEITYNTNQYEQNLMELLINRAYLGHLVMDIIWLDDKTVEIKYYQQPDRIATIDELTPEFNAVFQYFYNSRQYGHDWIEYSSEEKDQFLREMISFWSSKYGYYRLLAPSDIVLKDMQSYLDNHFVEDNLYSSIGQIMENRAFDRGFIERVPVNP
ncbi:SLH domain protein of unknown function [Alkalihalophilus pseudofirmus OF4]|uniref:SLH domain-containing protein n=1 Tax=Alkalihalophilus pseudofirmus (strain ATCC BAA-2126 / JCM 17055 / OF4) TaxID=398511 RepID=D3FZK8_ALKPO|nr:S-layer homology domain-containing protein [Alkalihalophilus pseudofirmus]ADC49250.1 SLH domain protein of unknown function [Alkalihalophilus pseudofirmus OF4]